MYLILFVSIVLQLYFLGRFFLFLLENLIVGALIPFVNWGNNLREKNYLIQIKRIPYEDKDSDDESYDSDSSDSDSSDTNTSESKEDETNNDETNNDETNNDETKEDATKKEYNNLPNSDTLSTNSDDSEKKQYYIDTTLD
jgi:hypothetical protein